MKKTKILLIALSLLVSINASISESPRMLFKKAEKEIEKAQKAEESSFSIALTHYTNALFLLDELMKEYPSSKMTTEISICSIKAGPYCYWKLSDEVIPRTEIIVKAEKDILSTALYLTEKLDFEEVYPGDHLVNISTAYVEEENLNKAFEVVKRIEYSDYSKDWESKDRSRAYKNIASYLIDRGDLEKASEIIDLIEYPYFKAESLSKIALAYSQSGNYNLAETIFHEAIKATNDMDFSLQKDLAVCRISYNYSEAGGKDEKLLKELYEISYEIHKRTRTGGFESGSIGCVTRAYEKANMLEVSLKIIKHLDDKPLMEKASFLCRISYEYKGKGNEVMAEKDLNEAIRIAREEEEPSFKAWTLIELAACSADGGDKELSEKLFQDALENLAKNDENGGKAIYSIYFVTAYIEAGFNNEDVLKEILNICKDIELKERKAFLLDILSKAYSKLGNNDMALKLLEGELFTIREINDLSQRISGYKDLASSYDELGKNDMALKLLKEELLAIREVDDIFQRISDYKDLASSYTELGKKDTAINVINDALYNASKINDVTEKGLALGYIANSYGKAGLTDMKTLNEIIKVAFTIKDENKRYSYIIEILLKYYEGNKKN